MCRPSWSKSFSLPSNTVKLFKVTSGSAKGSFASVVVLLLLQVTWPEENLLAMLLWRYNNPKKINSIFYYKYSVCDNIFSASHVVHVHFYSMPTLLVYMPYYSQNEVWVLGFEMLFFCEIAEREHRTTVGIISCGSYLGNARNLLQL